MNSSKTDNACLVSILMPMHNARKTVASAIASITAQTYTHFEVICVDDASTDGTREIVYGLAQSEPRIRYQRLPQNKGVGAARNEALLLAQGDYICFVDSDDTVEPDFVETLVMQMVVDNTQVACCGWDRGIGSRERSFSNKTVWGTERMLHALVSNLTFFTSLWNKMFRRDAFVMPNGLIVPFGETFQVGEDEEWLSRVLQRCKGCSIIPDVLYHWNATEGSLSFHRGLESDEKAFSHLSALEHTYHNLSLYGKAGVRAQSRLTSSLVQLLVDRYTRQTSLASNNYREILQRACLAIGITGGGLSKVKSRILVVMIILRVPHSLVGLVYKL